jgi:hypothetical protein
LVLRRSITWAGLFNGKRRDIPLSHKNLEPLFSRVRVRPIIAAIASLATIFAGCALVNRAPVIAELSADKDSISIGASCELKASATDPDGDELTYEWLVPTGKIKGEGPSVTWKGPAIPGDHEVVLTVNDGRGKEVTGTLTITVIPNQAPVIKRLSTKLVVCKESEPVAIECVASDPDGDELSYHWTATGGEILGQGPVVSWVAPDKNGSYTVGVAVTDGKGGEVTSEKQIRVT